MSAIRTRQDKTTLLVTKGDNGHFRTLRAITYKKILNKSNAILAACLHLLATFGLECRAFACKKNTICKKVEGGGGESKHPPAPPRPPPMVCKAHHTLADFLSRDSRFFIADKTVWFLGSSHTSQFFVADLLSSYVTRVQILRGNCETFLAKITLFHWLQHIFVADKLSGTTTH